MVIVCQLVSYQIHKSMWHVLKDSKGHNGLVKNRPLYIIYFTTIATNEISIYPNLNMWVYELNVLVCKKLNVVHTSSGVT